jgi:hypothetical protein
MMDDAYAKLVAFLDRHGAAYRLIDHPPEGQTDKVSIDAGGALQIEPQSAGASPGPVCYDRRRRSNGGIKWERPNPPY